jgi:hypothetical protein
VIVVGGVKKQIIIITLKKMVYHPEEEIRVSRGITNTNLITTTTGSNNNKSSMMGMDLVTPKGTAEHGVLMGSSLVGGASQSATTISTGVDQEEDPLLSTVAHTRRVLVAKRLTNSDASSGRIILPRVAVETNMSFVTAYKHYGLHVKDVFGQEYEFVVKSWANGTEHRRVFVLEQVGKFLKQHHIGVGDTVGIVSVGDGFVVEVNSEDVKAVASNGRCSTPAAVTPSHQSMQSKQPFAPVQNQCVRSSHCSKMAGHPGFCSGPKGVSFRSSGKSQSQSSALQYQYGYDDYESSQGVEYVGGRDDAYLTSSDDTAVQPDVNGVYMSEDMVNKELQQLPDGLNRLVYVPARVKIVKKLTSYDLLSRRIVLPAEQACDGLVNVCPEKSVYTLATVDESHGWQFMTMRSWYSVTGRLGYLIEDSNDILKSRNAQDGDYLMIYRDSIQSPPKIVLLEGETCRVKKPVDGPDAEMTFSELPLLLLPPGENQDVMSGTHSVRALKKWHQSNDGCNRTMGCTKVYGHQGFCSGHQGFKRKESETPTSRFGDHPFRFGSASSEEEDATPMHRRGGTPKSRRIRGPSDPLVSLLNLLE